MLDHALPAWPMFSAFLLASLLLAVTPGPGVLYIVTRSVVQGRRSGLLSVAGVAVGNLCNALAAALGLAALFAASAQAFVIVKYAGAIYLVYLGIQMVRSASDELAAVSEQPRRLPLRKLFSDGLLVALLNPKTIIFFAAFLPQFLTPNGSQPALQACVLGTIFVAIAMLTDSVYALTASLLAPTLTKARGLRRFGRYAGGASFIGLGIFAALAGTRPQAS